MGLNAELDQEGISWVGPVCFHATAPACTKELENSTLRAIVGGGPWPKNLWQTGKISRV